MDIDAPLPAEMEFTADEARGESRNSTVLQDIFMGKFESTEVILNRSPETYC